MFQLLSLSSDKCSPGYLGGHPTHRQRVPAPRRVALASSPFLPLRLIESAVDVDVVETHMDVTCEYAADIARAQSVMQRAQDTCL